MAKTANINVRIDPETKASFNLETEMAMEEAKLIMAGKIPAKRYASVHELLDELETDG